MQESHQKKQNPKCCFSAVNESNALSFCNPQPINKYVRNFSDALCYMYDIRYRNAVVGSAIYEHVTVGGK